MSVNNLSRVIISFCQNVNKVIHQREDFRPLFKVR